MSASAVSAVIIVEWFRRKSSDQAPSGSERGYKRSASSGDVPPAPDLAVKLLKAQAARLPQL